MSTVPAPSVARPGLFSTLKTFTLKVFAGWSDDNIPRLAAALSFYAVLSLAPLLVLAVSIGSRILGQTSTLDHLLSQVSQVMGKDAAVFVGDLIAKAQRTDSSVIAAVLSLGVTFFSASNLFIQLNDTINWMWRVKPEGSFVRSLILTRIFAFVSVVVFGGIVLAWLVLDSWLGWLARHSEGFGAWPLVSFLASTAFLTLVFAGSMKAIPKDHVSWRDVWPGALVAAIGVALFKLLLSQYLVGAGATSAYGAAGALVAILLWIYYTAQVYLFGVEVTCVYAHEHGSRNGRDSLRSADVPSAPR